VSERDFLGEILVRKALENRRRAKHHAVLERVSASVARENRGTKAIAALRRPANEPVRFIAEVKFASPSAGPIRARRAGEAARVATDYVRGGAAAVSVLADAPGFAGSPLDVRRVATAISAPVLFKEFVLDESQIELARCVGASMVLLLVRALSGSRLEELILEARRAGLEPVVEAADEAELDFALATSATIVGVNARDLRTFRVDPQMAERAMARVPDDRIAVFMSGIRDREDVLRVSQTRADAVLVGEGLMRAPDPGAKLFELRGAT
jgi:indole-3-glycerol phosphate synthase